MPEHPPDVRHEIKILEGDLFFVSDEAGNVLEVGPYGLFFRDTRFLSRYAITINGQIPHVLTSREINYFSAAFFLANPELEEVEENTLSIVRRRFVGSAVHEDLIVDNHNRWPVALQIVFECDCDFADLFEIKSRNIVKKGQYAREGDEERHILRYSYRRDEFVRATEISFSERPRLEEHRAIFGVTIGARESWQTCIQIALETESERRQPRYGCKEFGRGQTTFDRSIVKWRQTVPELSTDSDVLLHTYVKASEDLAALRLRDKHNQVPAAGLPWFMTLFGRDTLITSYQTLLFGPDLAIGALGALARYQGTTVDDFRDEQPGKILHELRAGELTFFGDKPHSPYYGTVDATLLFLILLSEVYRWTADPTIVNGLRENAMRALEWIDRYGDLDRDGYVEYNTRSLQGLRDQGWKDSGDAIVFSDGRLANPPIALCEVQGYVYDAKLRVADLAEQVWHEYELAAKLRSDAAGLKKQFNRDFWCGSTLGSGYFALALDRDKQQVDSLTSNIGHLLWTGIVEEEKIQPTVDALMSDPLYSGWGIRTLSRTDQGYNPIAYHRGTVWPHDNSIIAAGLARCGHRKEANRIVADLLAAGAGFGYRLPEAFAGYSRQRYQFPVRYPTSSSPQAWAAGALVLLLQAMLGLAPDRERAGLSLSPVLPEGIRRVELLGVKAFGKRFRVSVQDGRCETEELSSRETGQVGWAPE